jgi:CubicO group peptidase (beta-lactamase class C family)
MRFAAVRDQLAQAVGRVFPAAQLVVVDAGATVLDEAVGACDPGTIFDVASLTKALVTTTLTMRLLDEGRLKLTDEIRPGMTVRAALAHATGLPAWRPLHERLGEESVDPRREMVALARAEPPETAPGVRSVYSDLGFILLGDVVEQAGGARLDEQWAPIAKSLGVAASFEPDPERCAPTRDGGGDREWESLLRGTVNDDNALAMEGVAGHAGLFSTGREVAKIGLALVAAWAGEDGIVKRETLRDFWSPSGIPRSTWCLGWDSPSLEKSQAGTLWPRDGVGHLGFTGCSLWIDPPRSRLVVLLSNRVYGDGDREAIKTFRPALHDAIVRALGAG